MKYVILRCEDRAPAAAGRAALLEGAKTAHLRHVAQAGAAGTIRSPAPNGQRERLRLHRSLLGAHPDDPVADPGSCYAAAVGLALAPDETAWCCDLVTQRDGAVVDADGGKIPTTQSRSTGSTDSIGTCAYTRSSWLSRFRITAARCSKDRSSAARGPG